MKFNKKNRLIKVLFILFLAVICFSIDNVRALDDSDFSSYCKYKLSINGEVAICDLDDVYIYIGTKTKKDDVIVQGSSACFRVGDQTEFYKDEQSMVVLGGDEKNYCPTVVNYCPSTFLTVSVFGHLTLSGNCSNSVSKFTLVDIKGNTYKKYEPVSTLPCKSGKNELSKLDAKITELDKTISSDNISNTTIKQIAEEKKSLTSSITKAIESNYCEQNELENIQKKYETFNTKFINRVEKSSLSSAEKENLKSTANTETKKINDTALSVKNNYSLSNKTNIELPNGDYLNKCEDLISEDLMYVINLVLKIIQIGGPILLIILVAVDFGQVVISNDKDAMPKAVSKAIKRGIAAIVIFFVPYFVSLILDWLNNYSSITGAGNCIK